MGYDVFISYDSRDLTFADKLVSRLESRGYKCWIDRGEIVAGKEFDEEIFTAITENPGLLLVVLLSEKTLQSKYVKDEIRLAYDNNLHIIPVFIEDIKLTGAYALRLNGRHRIDAFNLDIDTVADKICVAVKQQKPDLPTPTPIPTPIPSERFVDNDDQTITDNSTILMWTKDANLAGRKTWQEALDYIELMNKGATENFGYTDWRLPDAGELGSLIKSRNGAPYAWLQSQGFTNVQADSYWSSTSHSGYTSFAWVVGMDGGNLDAYLKSSYDSDVWPVRSVC
ncbi:protein containing DUF1566 [Candidatus Magnetobacterium bavaricum]|uniref:Protein containing DUF1566 n=1 Tax=Candidatus Magnetobacterium bavaricum TaxID=29290 RepID=A0A0F3GMP1_9BACT|nr:protein containing DUF1566 [Candidatus Magnetobacterium bavaricum]